MLIRSIRTASSSRDSQTVPNGAGRADKAFVWQTGTEARRAAEGEEPGETDRNPRESFFRIPIMMCLHNYMRSLSRESAKFVDAVTKMLGKNCPERVERKTLCRETFRRKVEE